jgi:hypothetical protein
MTPRLSKGAAGILDDHLDDWFDSLKIRLLGPVFSPKSKKLWVGFQHELSIPGLFEKAVSEEGGKVDTSLLDHLIEITADFIDKHRGDAKARVKKTVQDLITDLDNGKIAPKDFTATVASQVEDVLDSITANISKVVQTQTQNTQTLGIKDGIDFINSNIGIEDPTVCFLPVKDHLLCSECRRLHLSDDGSTPRVWLSSEVKSGYHSKGDQEPSWSLLHPHCRCALATVLPGFGFNSGGLIVWKNVEHDEWAFQRGEDSRFAKSEFFIENLTKSTPAGLLIFEKLKERYKENSKIDRHTTDIEDIRSRWDARKRDYDSDVAKDHYWALGLPAMKEHYKNATPERKTEIDQAIAAIKPSMHPTDRKWVIPAHALPATDPRRSNHSFVSVDISPEEAAKYGPKAKLEAVKVPRDDTKLDKILDEVVPAGWKDFPEKHYKPTEKLIEAFRNAPLTINMPAHILRPFFEAGRYKNLFETGEGQGETDQDTRTNQEKLKLGIDIDVPAEQRPVYGALNWSAGFPGGLGEHRGGADMYGDVWLDLDPEIKKRSSLTVGDSFGVKPDDVVLGEDTEAIASVFTQKRRNVVEHLNRYSHHGHDPVPGNLYKGFDNDDERSISDKIRNASYDYIEAQIHGGVTLKDVKAIHFRQKPDEESMSYAKKFNVPIHVHSNGKVEVIQPTELKKGLKGALAGIALAIPAMTDNLNLNFQPGVMHGPEDTPMNVAADDLHPHLKAISFLESSGGQNLNHAKVSKDDYFNAHGQLGFKPMVAHEVWQKSPELQKKYPGLKSKGAFLNAFRTYPAVYNGIANHYWNGLLKTFGNDSGRAAYAWRLGKYKALWATDPKEWQNHEYVQRFTDLYRPLGKAEPKPVKPKKLKKVPAPKAG